MSEGKSEPTILAEMLADEIARMVETIAEEWPHPIGMEKQTKEQARRRFLGMTPEQRQVELARVGVRAIRDLMEVRGRET